MSRIKVAHLHKLLNKHAKEEISFSKIVEELNNIANSFDISEPVEYSEHLNKEEFEIQRELLELSIKSGRRLMHDFNHLIDELPNNHPSKKMYRERAEIWQSIFYPDNGMKNYRTQLHVEIDRLNSEVRVLKDKLKKQ